MIHDALSSNKLGISNPSQVGVDIKMTLPLLVAALCFNGAGIGGQQVREMLPILLSEHIRRVFIGSNTSRTIALQCTSLLVPLKSCDRHIAFMLWEEIYASALGGGSRGRNA